MQITTASPLLLKDVYRNFLGVSGLGGGTSWMLGGCMRIIS